MSTDYVPRPGTAASFEELLELGWLNVASANGSKLELAEAPLDPSKEYAFSDGNGVLWVNFNQDGIAVSATRYGAGGNVEELLQHLGDMVSEEDDEYFELIGPDDHDVVKESVPVPTGVPGAAIRARQRRAAFRRRRNESRVLRAEQLVSRLLDSRSRP